jgi:SAM-dependent methyltransferase
MKRLLNRAFWVIDTLRDQLWLLRRMRIGSQDLVLDVGSGASPALRANVCADKFPVDKTERGGQAIRRDRPFVIGDVSALPFADDSFDFVICSHVLEHVEDPARAVAELQRVAPRGYLETPSAVWERATGFPFHRWMVSFEEGSLVFLSKSKPFEDPQLAEWFSVLVDRLHLRRAIWFWRRRLGVYTSLMWDTTIPVDVRNSVDDSRFVSAHSGSHECSEPAQRTGHISVLLNAYSRFIRRRSDRPWREISALLRCPACGGHLIEASAFSCSDCDRLYPKDSRGAPHLIVDVAR